VSKWGLLARHQDDKPISHEEGEMQYVLTFRGQVGRRLTAEEEGRWPAWFEQIKGVYPLASWPLLFAQIRVLIRHFYTSRSATPLPARSLANNYQRVTTPPTAPRSGGALRHMPRGLNEACS
jgi:hypothetical protein